MQRKPTRAVAPTLYLTEDELPPDLVYIVWGDPNDPFITEYRSRLRRGAPIGVKADGSTRTTYEPGPGES